MENSAVSLSCREKLAFYQFNPPAAFAFAGVVITTLGILLQAYTNIGSIGALVMNVGGICLTVVSLLVMAIKEKTPHRLEYHASSTSDKVKKEKQHLATEQMREVPKEKQKLTQAQFNELLTGFIEASTKEEEESFLDQMEAALKQDKNLFPKNSSFSQHPLSHMNAGKAFAFVGMLMIECHIDPNQFQNQGSFLHILAAFDDYNEAVVHLLETLDRTNKTDHKGLISLHYACMMDPLTKTISAPKNAEALLQHAKARGYDIHIREPLNGLLNKPLTPFLRACQGPYSRLISSKKLEFTDAEKKLFPLLMEGIENLALELAHLEILHSDSEKANLKTLQDALEALKNQIEQARQFELQMAEKALRDATGLG